jgi:hypothetical protein
VDNSVNSNLHLRREEFQPVSQNVSASEYIRANTIRIPVRTTHADSRGKKIIYTFQPETSHYVRLQTANLFPQIIYFTISYFLRALISSLAIMKPSAQKSPYIVIFHHKLHVSCAKKNVVSIADGMWFGLATAASSYNRVVTKA